MQQLGMSAQEYAEELQARSASVLNYPCDDMAKTVYGTMRQVSKEWAQDKKNAN